jgi:hypothetical protein
MSFRWPLAVIFAFLFVLAGLPFLTPIGVHVDASNEVGCFLGCIHPVYGSRIFGFGARTPIMVISYLGAFKAWLYQPIFRLFGTGVLALRLPTLLVGAGTVAMFFILLDRVIGRAAAILGTVLLITDVSFLLATGLDFGPVAFLHFFMLAGMLLLLRFQEIESPVFLAAAFFLFGLGLWQKAMFLFMLAGLFAGALATFPKVVGRLASGRHLAIAVLAFCAGASPLIYYNLRTFGATFRTGDVMSPTTSLAQKFQILTSTLDGSVVFGFITEEAQPAVATPPTSAMTQASVRVNALTGEQRSNGMLMAFSLSLLAFPLLWFSAYRRIALFALTVMAVIWGEMLMIPKTGGGLHHALLIWPFPHLFMAVAAAALIKRFGKAGAAGVTVIAILVVYSNIMVINKVYAHLATTGTTALWSDATKPMVDYASSVENARFVAVDWGYAQTMCLLSNGKLPVRELSFELLRFSPEDGQAVHSALADPANVFVGRFPEDEQFEGVGRRLDAVAAAEGYSRRILTVIHDRNQRPRYQLIRYER